MASKLKQIAAEEIIQSRPAWLAQYGGVKKLSSSLSTSRPIIPLMMRFDSNFNIIPLKYECVDVNQNEILSVSLPGGEDPSVVIVSGNAGMGKTTLLSSIVEKFDAAKTAAAALSSLIEKSDKDDNDNNNNSTDIRSIETENNTTTTTTITSSSSFSSIADEECDQNVFGENVPGLSSFEFVFYISMRCNNFDNFNDYLKSLLPQTLGGKDDDDDDDLERVLGALSQSKCLILFDGYDEANDKSQKLFERLIRLNNNNNNFPEYKFIVTTRPDKIKELTNIIDDAQITSRIVLKILCLRSKDMMLLVDKIIDNFRIKNNSRHVDDHTRGKLEKVIGKLEKKCFTFMTLCNPLYFSRFVFSYITNFEFRKKINNIDLAADITLFLELEAYKREWIVEKTGIRSEALMEFDDLYTRYVFDLYKCIKIRDTFSSYANVQFSDYNIDEVIADRIKRISFHFFEEEPSEYYIDYIKSKVKHNRDVKDNFDYIISSYLNIRHREIREECDYVYEKEYYYRNVRETEFVVAKRICDDIIMAKEGRKGTDLIDYDISPFAISSGIGGLWMRSFYEIEKRYNDDVYEIEDKISEHRDHIIDFHGYIIQILYNLNKNVLYSVLGDIYDSMLLYGGNSVFDFILSFSQFFLTDDRFSIILQNWLSKNLNNMCLFRIHSLSILSPFLTKKLVDLKGRQCRAKLNANFTNIDGKLKDLFLFVKKTVEDAATHGFKVELHMVLFLKQIVKISSFPVMNVDEITLHVISNFKRVKANTLRSLPISAKNMTVKYSSYKDEICLDDIQSLNAIWPTGGVSGNACLELCKPVMEEKIVPLLESLEVGSLKELKFSNIYFFNVRIFKKIKEIFTIKGWKTFVLTRQNVKIAAVKRIEDSTAAT